MKKINIKSRLAEFQESRSKDNKIVVLLTIAFLVVFISGWVGYSYFEAKSFTKLTGREVELFYAMFVDLRVMEPIK